MDYDVVIVGAGIAGCTAARLYGQAGLRVALVEKHRNPATFKALCGHFVQAGTHPTLRRLGLWEAMRSAGAGVGTVGNWTRFGWMEPDPEWPAPLCLRRERMDPLLRRWAAGTPGVDLLLGRTVNGLVETGGRIIGVRTTGDVGAEELRARLVVGADGHRSAVARLADVEASVAPNERFAVWAYYRGVRLRGRGFHQVWRLDPDCAFAVRCDDDLTVLVAYPHKGRLPEFRANTLVALERFVAALPDAPDMSGAERVSKLIGTYDYPCVRRDPAPRPGLALAGDASLTGDPLPAVGCGWAFRAGEWLADSTAPALLGQEPIEPGLARYRHAYRFVWEHDDLGREDAKGLPMTPLQLAMRAAATRDRGVAHRLYLFGTRAIPASELRDPTFIRRVQEVAGAVLRPAGTTPSA
jgi:flavin-dependent dehydrogenase